MNKFEKIYFEILTEEKSPTSFTPEELLNDVRNKCFSSSGEFLFYTINQLEKFSDNSNKELFKILIKNLKNKNDYGILFIYFSSFNELNDILNKHGYFEPHKNYPNFSMKIVYKQFKKFFEDSGKNGLNFNSIDVCPELGCVIGINGSLINSNRDFEKVLDHEINHYFEKMNIHYDLKNNVDNISDIKSEKILKKLLEFYHIDFSNKGSFIDDLKYHIFNYNEFRSMSADVFHEILRYNEKHFKELNFHEFINDIENCNYLKYDFEIQDYIIFCWICKQISNNRWEILLKGIKEAISIKKNIFQKFLINSKDFIRNFYLKVKEMNK